MKRRQILSAMGAGAMISFTGCTSFFNRDITLAPVSIISDRGAKGPVQARIEYNGEVVENSTHDFDATDVAVIDCAWPEEPGEFVIGVRVEGEDEWVEEDFSDHDHDCAYVVIHYYDANTFSFGILDNCPDEMC